MIDSKFSVAISVAICYLAIKFIEMRFVLKENKPLKLLLRDTLLVYISVIGGIFILEQFAPLTESIKSAPMVFTSDPDF
jgi:hypothetical protein